MRWFNSNWRDYTSFDECIIKDETDFLPDKLKGHGYDSEWMKFYEIYKEKRGVYRIIVSDKNVDEVVYIGEGNIGHRLSVKIDAPKSRRDNDNRDYLMEQNRKEKTIRLEILLTANTKLIEYFALIEHIHTQKKSPILNKEPQLKDEDCIIWKNTLVLPHDNHM